MYGIVNTTIWTAPPTKLKSSIHSSCEKFPQGTVPSSSCNLLRNSKFKAESDKVSVLLLSLLVIGDVRPAALSGKLAAVQRAMPPQTPIWISRGNMKTSIN